MADPGSKRRERKLDLAARAAWLYYIADNTQEEIAAKLDVSRQAAQRLVALAVSEKLIKFRLHHPLSSCIAIAEALRDKFSLSVCEVVPSTDNNLRTGLGICGATYLETYLTDKSPAIIAFSSGRTLRAMVEQIPSMDQPQHKLVSIVGNLSHYGRAGWYEVVMNLSDRTNASAYPMPTPVVATSTKEKKLLQTQKSFIAVQTLQSHLCRHWRHYLERAASRKRLHQRQRNQGADGARRYRRNCWMGVQSGRNFTQKRNQRASCRRSPRTPR